MILTQPTMNGMIGPHAAGPITSGFEFWVDGQPIAVTVSGDSMAYWVDGQPIEEEVG